MSTEPGSDPFGDLQRWLMKAGAKSISREVADRVKSTIGGGKEKKHGDVWDTATTEDPPDEAPECQWCPICRAARRYRESGGSPAAFTGQFAGVGDTLAGLTRDAFSLFESAMRAPQRPGPPASRNRPSAPSAGAGPAGDGTWRSATSDGATADSATADSAASDGAASDNGPVIRPGVGWPAVVHTKHEDYEAGHEGGDGEEGGQARDGGADSGTDEQVERTAE